MVEYRLPLDVRPTGEQEPLQVYQDTAFERATDDFYAREIWPALQASSHLIVIATPSALEPRPDGSNWVEREIEDFLTFDPPRPILAAIAAGKLTDPLPAGLGTQRLKSIQRIDIRALTRVRRLWPSTRARLDTELLKIVATLCGIPPDRVPLLRREAAQRRRDRRSKLAASVLLPTLVVGGGVYWLTGQLTTERALARANRLRTAGRSLLVPAAPDRALTDDARQTALALGIYAVDSLRRVTNEAPLEIEAFLRQAASASSLLQTFEGSTENHSDNPITWSPDGLKLFVPAIDSVATIDGSIVRRESSAAAWSRDGSTMAFTSRRGLEIFVGTRDEKTRREGEPYPVPGVQALSPIKWNADLSRFVTRGVQTGYLQNPVAIGGSGGTVEQSLVVPNLYCYDWSPDGTMLLVQGATEREDRNRLVKVVNVVLSSDEVVDLPPISSEKRVAWDHRNRPVALSSDGAVEVFDPRTGRLQETQDLGPGASIGFPLALHPQGMRYVASASEAWLRIWDSVAKRRAIITFPMHINVTTSGIAWSPDGEKIAVHLRTSQRNVVMVYDVRFALAASQSELLAAARRYLRKDFAFSAEVCRQLFEDVVCPDRASLLR